MSLNENNFSISGVFWTFSHYKVCHTRYEFNIDQIEQPTKKAKNEILQLDIKSVVMENY